MITGATGGLGLAAATALAQQGHRVIVGARDERRGAAVARQLGAELALVDLAELRSVHAAADRLLADGRPIDVLVNNAGAFLKPGLSVDGFETHVATNHLGHFALTARLAPLLRRVVTVSSLGHWTGRFPRSEDDWRRPRNRLQAYNDAKLANLAFALELDRRTPITGVAVHPGATRTGLVSVPGIHALFSPIEVGVQPHLQAVTGRLRGGEYLGPSKLLGTRGAPRTDTPRRRISAEDANRVWQISEALTGVEFRVAH